MADIIVDPKVFNKSKVHPTIIERVRQKMLRDPAPTRPKAKRKWPEIVYLIDAGVRFLVSCQIEDEIIVITNMQQLKKK